MRGDVWVFVGVLLMVAGFLTFVKLSHQRPLRRLTIRQGDATTVRYVP